MWIRAFSSLLQRRQRRNLNLKISHVVLKVKFSKIPQTAFKASLTLLTIAVIQITFLTTGDKKMVNSIIVKLTILILINELMSFEAPFSRYVLSDVGLFWFGFSINAA